MTLQASCERQVAQMPFPLNELTCSVDPQKMQVLSTLRSTMLDPSIEIVRWSPSRMLNRRRVSAGMTILPRSSIFLEMPESMSLSGRPPTPRHLTDTHAAVSAPKPLSSTVGRWWR